jgi:hypothetical protein
MRTKLVRFFLHAAFGLGLCSFTALTAQAEDYHYIPQGPVYVKPNCPAPGIPAPVVTPAPSPHPADLPKDGATTPTPAPGTPGAAQNVPTPADTSAAPPAPADTGAAAEGPTAGGEAAAMLGRGDSNNRFNLFDNMAAIPQNRVWFTYEQQQNFQTGVGLNPGNPTITTDFAERRTVNLYRVGAEIKIGQRFSIAAQDQYIASGDTANAADAWGVPQFMAKFALILNDTTAVSAILGFSPQVSSNDGELHEKTTRYYPGMLFYQSLGEKFFVQGGFQFGISDRDAPNTFDYAVSTGYWLYRANCSEGNKPFLTGIAPQIEIFGKHILANGSNNPFDIQGTDFGTSAPFREPRNIYDVTAGAGIYLKEKVSIGTAFSFPITGGSARRTEFLANLTYRF